MGKRKNAALATPVPDIADIRYNVMNLLRTEKYDSRPNMGKFLKQYVMSVRLAINNGKVELWPRIGYSATKAFLKFKDGHELVKDYTASGNFPKFYLFDNLDELEITEHQEKVIEKFFSYLEGFKFIRVNQQSVEQMIQTDGIEKLNEKLETENKIIEAHLLSGDFTPQIVCT